MTLGLEWTGGESFAAEPLRDWMVEGDIAGKVRSSGALTYATIQGAGHFVRLLQFCPALETVIVDLSDLTVNLSFHQVPYDKPKESLEMLKRWIAGKDF